MVQNHEFKDTSIIPKTNGQKILPQKTSRRSFAIRVLGAVTTAGIGVGVIASRQLYGRPSVQMSVNGPFSGKHTFPLSSPNREIVDTKSILIQPYGDGLEVRLQIIFSFAGTPSKSSVIKVLILALSKDGKELGTKTLICKDKRANTPAPYFLGPIKIVSSPLNCESFTMQLKAQEQIHSFKLQFAPA